MRPPALGAISGGIRYQLRLFWLHALPMISRPGVERVSMEHGGADGVDDLAVFYSAPGRNDAGRITDADFFQSKFHVAQSSAIDHGFFTDAGRTGTSRPLIARMADTWSSQRVAYPCCRLTFLTNWSWDPSDPLRKLVRDSGHLDPAIFTATSRSAVGKIRDSWQSTTGLDEDLFRQFLGSLRLQVPWGAQWQVDERMRDLMHVAGLLVPPLEHECVALDDLGAHFLETGRTEWTTESLRAALAQEGLYARAEGRRAPVVAVRSFLRFAGLDVPPGTVDIDLADLFEGRLPRSADAWTTMIPERLDQRLHEIARLEQPVELALDCHLSIAWHLGMLLDSKSGVRVALRQKGLDRGTEVWDPKARTGAEDQWDIAAGPGTGAEVVVAVSVTHTIDADVEGSMAHLGLGGARFIHATVRRPGPSAIANGEHAAALASELVAKLREHAPPDRTTHVHVFLAAPVSFAFLLGQRGAILGPTTTYEFDFNASRTYAPGMSSPRPDGHSR